MIWRQLASMLLAALCFGGCLYTRFMVYQTGRKLRASGLNGARKELYRQDCTAENLRVIKSFFCAAAVFLTIPMIRAGHSIDRYTIMRDSLIDGIAIVTVLASYKSVMGSRRLKAMFYNTTESEEK